VAVQGLGQDARRRGLAASARAGKKESVRDPAALERVQEGAGHVFLADQLMEILGTPLAGKNLVLHRNKKMGRAPGDLRHI